METTNFPKIYPIKANLVNTQTVSVCPIEAPKSLMTMHDYRTESPIMWYLIKDDNHLKILEAIKSGEINHIIECRNESKYKISNEHLFYETLTHGTVESAIDLYNVLGGRKLQLKQSYMISSIVKSKNTSLFKILLDSIGQNFESPWGAIDTILEANIPEFFSMYRIVDEKGLIKRGILDDFFYKMEYHHVGTFFKSKPVYEEIYNFTAIINNVNKDHKLFQLREAFVNLVDRRSIDQHSRSLVIKAFNFMNKFEINSLGEIVDFFEIQGIDNE